MSKRPWLDKETWRLMSHHISGVLAVIAGYNVVFWLVHWGLSDGPLKAIMEDADEFVTVGLLLILAWRVLKIASRWL